MTTHRQTVAVIGTGDMGSAVGGALLRAGYRVVTAGNGRSAPSRSLANAAGIEDLGTLDAVVRASQLVLSIVPPAVALTFATSVVQAMQAASVRPVFADCNAVAPATVQAVAHAIEPSGAPFVDIGIVGRGPLLGGERTRFYASGAARAAVLELAVDALEFVDLGPDVGRASAMKMAYSSLNKGTDALLTAVLLAAERLGVRAPLMRELEFSQAAALKRMRARVPFWARRRSVFRPRWSRSPQPLRVSASRRSSIAAPSGSTLSSRPRHSQPRLVRRSRRNARSTKPSPC
jgi:3-hydroxyisobutyrate dehydrogenase-like beta-hydroxyacid dehydrogenase